MKTLNRIQGRYVEYSHVVRIPMGDPVVTFFAQIAENSYVKSDLGVMLLVSYGPIENIGDVNNFLYYAVEAPDEEPANEVLYAYDHTEQFTAQMEDKVDSIRVIHIKEDEDGTE